MLVRHRRTLSAAGEMVATNVPSSQRKLGSSDLLSVNGTGLTSFAVVKRLSFRWNDESVVLNLQAKIEHLDYAPEVAGPRRSSEQRT